MQGLRERLREGARTLLLPVAAFLVAFLALPVRTLGGLTRFPSDLGDGRLNAYFVDNVYQFLVGGGGSLWDLGIFHPYPYTLGFSDNLFGAAPIYVLARLLTGETFLAFMLWWYAAWPVNYVASYWAFRKLGLARLGATTGALVFTFALPVSSMFPWPQFAYRFGAPLAVAAWWVFLRDRRWSQVVVASLWTVWQFYCGIYMGVFTVVVLAAVTIGWVATAWWSAGLRRVPAGLGAWDASIRALGPKRLLAGAAALGALAAAMVLLLWPYLRVTQLYGLTRSYAEIEPMLPTWRTYLQSDYSWLWKGLLAHVPHPPMHWEHQFFPGLALAALVALGAVLLPRPEAGGSRLRGHAVAPAMAVALLVMLGATFSLRGHSLWAIVSQAPLFSAIRAVARVSVVMLIPAGYLAGSAIDVLWGYRRRSATALLLGALLVESVAVTPISAPASDWRAADRTVTRVPPELPAGSVLFFAQSAGDAWWHDEVTAMWAARELQLTTLNGYSGGAPPGFTMTFGGDCSEAPTRVLNYLGFTKRPNDLAGYREEMSHIVPVGFSSCQSSWWMAPPRSTNEGQGPTPEQVSVLRTAIGSRTPTVEKTWTQADVTLTNTGSTTVIAGGLQPIRVWYRYVDGRNVVLTPWVGTGASLRYDLLPADVGTVTLPLDPTYLVSGGRVDVLVSTQGPDSPAPTEIPSASIPVR